MQLPRPWTLSALATLTVLATALPAQTQANKAISAEQKALIAKRKHKLEADFLSKADWVTSFAKARAKAAESGKLIFAYFTRSYAY